MDRFLVYNGEVVLKDEPKLLGFFKPGTINISRKIWYGHGGIPLFNENIDLLARQIGVLQLPVPEIFGDRHEFFRIVKRMLNKNRLYRSGFVFFQLLWDGGKFDLLVTAHPFETFDFPISAGGVLLNYSGITKYSGNSINSFPFFNEPVWQAAISQNRGTLFQNTILLNEKGAVCECAYANLFMFKGNELITPGIASGCFEDTLRPLVIETAMGLGFKITEKTDLKTKWLLLADEIFVASEETGIKWVMGVEKKRFVHEHSVSIHEKLNEYLKEKTGN